MNEIRGIMYLGGENNVFQKRVEIGLLSSGKRERRDNILEVAAPYHEVAIT